MFFSGIFSSNISYGIMFLGLLYYGLQILVFGVHKIHHVFGREDALDRKEIHLEKQRFSFSLNKHDYQFSEYKKNKTGKRLRKALSYEFPLKFPWSVSRICHRYDPSYYAVYEIRPFHCRAPPVM